MQHACTPILVGVAFPISEILLLLKTAKFPFPTMDYSPWSAKNLINWNQFKKFMQVGIDVTCMQANFGVCSFSNFRDIATFKNSHYSPWSAKELIDWNQLKKFMQVGVNVTCMHTNFGGWSPFGFGDFSTFKNGQISLSDHGL